MLNPSVPPIKHVSRNTFHFTPPEWLTEDIQQIASKTAQTQEGKKWRQVKNTPSKKLNTTGKHTLRHQHFSFGHLFLPALRCPNPRVMAELEKSWQVTQTLWAWTNLASLVQWHHANSQKLNPYISRYSGTKEKLFPAVQPPPNAFHWLEQGYDDTTLTVLAVIYLHYQTSDPFAKK